MQYTVVGLHRDSPLVMARMSFLAKAACDTLGFVERWCSTYCNAGPGTAHSARSNTWLYMISLPEKDDISMKISIITPTYNRAYTLPFLYESLAHQNGDFEWVVVDDGSTDETVEVVMGLQRKANFPIKYFRQQANMGPHVARNRAVQESIGELVGLVDSDDTVLANALDLVWNAWKDIPANRCENFAGVMGRCMTKDGALGATIPNGLSCLDVSWRDGFYKYGFTEERTPFYRRDVLRCYPFPETPDLRFVVEGVLHREIGRRYLLRYLNEPIRFYRVNGFDGLSMRPFRQLAGGRRPFYLATLNEDIDYFSLAPIRFLRWAAQYSRSSLHLGVWPRRQLADVRSIRSKLLALAGLPVGTALYVGDRTRDFMSK
ncbi:glycosyltransferase family 2 protein [Nonomuraea sp. NBC_00507]|uniref:glycosyltransferase family 2 protein n=1 Tax=Nonomuraea sp. NBC_00507 TaxID=2976002 RepID=UPI002E198561